MIIVTGGAGFIGSNIVQGLNARGITDILVVDDLTDGRKCLNLSDAHIRDYLDKDDFLQRVQSGHSFGPVEAVFHQGACSATTEWDGKFVMRVNYEYTKVLLAWTTAHKIPFYYASSASVYGGGSVFKENRGNEQPLNAYAFSKFLFDEHLRPLLKDIQSPVVGLRYFNVYGPRQDPHGEAGVVAFKWVLNPLVCSSTPCPQEAYQVTPGAAVQARPAHRAHRPGPGRVLLVVGPDRDLTPDIPVRSVIK